MVDAIDRVSEITGRSGESHVKVTDILTKKGPRIVTVKASETIGALSALLREKLVGAAVVSEDGQSVDGVISERDVAYGLSVHKAALHSLPVSALMTTTVTRVPPATRYRTWHRRWWRAIFAMCQLSRKVA